MNLHIDFETRCLLNLKVCGLDRYTRQAEVLMLGWAFDNDDPQIWEPRFGPMPKELCRGISSDCQLVAWNSSFERTIFGHVLGLDIPIERFCDPSTYARTLSLPGSLEDVSKILNLGDEGKSKEGKRLIKLFCEPASMGGEVTLFGVTEPYFREPEKHAADWELFKEYCRQDLRAERRILHELEDFAPPEIERRIWCLDQRINDAGLPVNREFVKKALTLAERSKEELKNLLKAKTGLENPNSRDQMLAWLKTQNYPYSSIEKGSVQSALAGNKITDLCREALTIRKEASKTSYKKFEAILDRLPEDDRLRHQYLYLGAARSGRWSGSGGVQVQNLPRPDKKVEKFLDEVLAWINELKYDALKEKYSSVITAVSSCTRSAFQAPVGKKIIVCDLNAIENRVLGWMAGCDAILQVFRDGRDPYMAFAALMYNCKYEDLADTSVIPHKPKNADAATKRQIAKSGILGCGYSLGPGVEVVCKNCRNPFGFRKFCVKCKSTEVAYNTVWKTDDYGDLHMTGLLKYAADMGVVMTPQQAYFTWYSFRQAYPEVVQLWKDLDRAATSVLKKGGVVQVGVVSFSKMDWNGKNILVMRLPSGRRLHYFNARIQVRIVKTREGGEKEKEAIEYEGIGHGVGTATEAEGGQTGWGPTFLHPGKIAENADQAISRDVFAHGLLLADEEGAEIIGHSHDEGLVLADDSMDFGLEDLKRCMSVTPPWAEGLPLAADGFESKVYRKN